jgi:hypothetical protein
MYFVLVTCIQFCCTFFNAIHVVIMCLYFRPVLYKKMWINIVTDILHIVFFLTFVLGRHWIVYCIAFDRFGSVFGFFGSYVVFTFFFFNLQFFRPEYHWVKMRIWCIKIGIVLVLYLLTFVTDLKMFKYRVHRSTSKYSDCSFHIF